MSIIEKALEIQPGDIVSVTVGRGWKRARVLKSLADNMLLLKFKNGETTKVSADHVLTEEEKKNLKRSKGATKIVRPNQNTREYEESEDDEESEFNPQVDSIEKSKNASFFRKLF